MHVLGLILAIAGGAARRGRVVTDHHAWAPRFEAGPGELGGSLAWDF